MRGGVCRGAPRAQARVGRLQFEKNSHAFPSCAAAGLALLGRCYVAPLKHTKAVGHPRNTPLETDVAHTSDCYLTAQRSAHTLACHGDSHQGRTRRPMIGIEWRLAALHYPPSSRQWIVAVARLFVRI